MPDELDQADYNLTEPVRPDTPPQPRDADAFTGAAPPSAGDAHPSGPPWVGSVHRRIDTDLHWLAVALVMLGSATFFFGWRGMLSVCVAALSTLGVYLALGLLIKVMWPQGHSVLTGLRTWLIRCCDRVPWPLPRRHAVSRHAHENKGMTSGALGKGIEKPGLWPRTPRHSHLHVLVLGMLFGLSLPLMPDPTLPLLGGTVLGVVAHLVGRTKWLRLHPVAVVLVLIWLMPAMFGVPDRQSHLWAGSEPVQAVLRREHVVVGDIAHMSRQVSFEPWWAPADPERTDAVHRPDPYLLLIRQQRQILQNRQMLVQLLSSGELCRLQEVVFGAVPGPVGATSRLLLIVLGLYLMYRRLAIWPMALTALVAAVTTVVWMPVRIDGQLTLAAERLVAMGPAAAITFLAYCLLASPLALIVMILAPGSCPTSRVGCVVFGLMVGCLAILAQWHFSHSAAPYLGLVVAGLFIRPLDALQRTEFIAATPD